MMTRKNILLAVSLLLPGLATAQAPEGNTLDRQVEVSRDYTPDVDRAAKLDIAPDMSDTVAIRPDFEYVIRPAAWLTGFGVAAINPARVDPTSYDPVYPFYLKIGGGYPGQSMLDLYATTTGKGINSAGVYANHYGQYPDIRNDMGEKKGAMMTSNRAGIFGKAGFYRYTFSGEAGVEHEVRSRYGMYMIEERPLSSYGGRSPIQGFLTPHGKVSIGTDFSDLSYFNFRVGAGIYHISDRTDNAELGFNAGLVLGKSFSGHRFFLSADYDGRKGKKNLAEYKNDIVTGGVKYEMITDRLNFSAGIRIGYDMPGGDQGDKTWFLPEAAISFDLADGYFVPYATLESGLHNNGYRTLSRINPYIESSPVLPGTSVEYHLRGGFSGSVASVFSYRVYAGGEQLKNMPFFYNNYRDGQTSDFGVAVEKRITAFVLGAELEGRVAGNFSVIATGNYHGYDGRTYADAFSLPRYEVAFRARYSWRNRLNAGLRAEVTGNRYFAEAPLAAATDSFDIIELGAVFQLGVDVEYALTRNIWVFAEGRNLTGAKLYPFNHYPDIGARVSLGAKLLF